MDYGNIGRVCVGGVGGVGGGGACGCGCGGVHVGVCVGGGVMAVWGGVMAVPFKDIVEVLYVDYGNIGRVCVGGGLCGGVCLGVRGLCGCVGVCV